MKSLARERKIERLAVHQSGRVIIKQTRSISPLGAVTAQVLTTYELGRE
jgi:hypothetical protein